ncbi:MAG: iron-containing alcohol dehydrogenase [Solirubrobacteraceae bacterium]
MDVAATLPDRSEFAAPTRIVAFRGCVRARLPDELAALMPTRVAVIADRGFAEAGLLEPLLAAAPDAPLATCALIGEDPDLDEAESAATAALELDAGAVLAVGGGSALCAAKAAAIRLSNPPPLTAYAGSGRLVRPPAPVIAVPTTAGSGSEVSNVVVLHEQGMARHLVIRGRGYEPPVALLDGDLIATLPPRPMIAAALDALTHALEALWVRTASSFTDALALAAAATVTSVLPRVLDDDRDAAQELIEASAIANLACGNTGLGLVHALSSAASVRLAHGRQNGVLLPHVAAFNRPMLRPGVARIVDGLAGLYDRIGFEARFADGELGPGDADAMVGAALANPFRELNCRPADESDLRALVRAAGA